MADRFYFYQYDIETKFFDFYEEVNKEVRMTANRVTFHKVGTYCYDVVESLKPLLIRVDDGSEKLDKEIRQDLENPIRYMLFYPVLYGFRFLGIVIFSNFEGQNGRNCEFTEIDTLSVSRMMTIFADVLAYIQILRESEKQTAHTEIFKKTLINFLKAKMRTQYVISGSIAIPKRLNRLKWELTDILDSNQMTYISKMFQTSYPFDWDRLKRFLLCAQIAHNDYPYHNIKTTFHICRTVYCINNLIGTKIKPYEKAALMIAAVVYYAGHNSLDNHLMLKTRHPLTRIYKMYFKENYKIWILNLLLDHTNFLRANKESETIISLTKTLLLKNKKLEAAIFREKIVKLLDTETFNINNETHRLYTLMIILRLSVHGRHMQPFNVAKVLRDNYYLEMHHLGDIEQVYNLNTIDRKNRDMQFKISYFEIEYITKAVLPTLNFLIRIFPETSGLLAMPGDVLTAHKILVSAENKKLWDPNAFGKKDRVYWAIKK